MSELLIKKEDIGNCRRCEAKPEGVKFKGLLNIGHFTCSHFNSDDGWWLHEILSGQMKKIKILLASFYAHLAAKSTVKI